MRNGIAIGSYAEVWNDNTAVIGDGRVTDVYFGSINGVSRLHSRGLYTQGAAGADVAGRDFPIVGAPSTGNAKPGALVFQLGKWDGASGETLNGVYDALRVESLLATVNRTKLVLPTYSVIAGGSLGFGVTGYSDCSMYMANGPLLTRTAAFGWCASAATAYSDVADTALMRNAAGVVEVNNGTLGQFRDLIVRNLIPSATPQVRDFSVRLQTRLGCPLAERNLCGLK
jgi:hypothetical protein